MRTPDEDAWIREKAAEEDGAFIPTNNIDLLKEGHSNGVYSSEAEANGAILREESGSHDTT